MGMTGQASIGIRRPVLTATPAAAWRLALMAYGVFAAAVCVLFWPSLADMARQWMTASTWRHGALAPPLVLGLILLRRNEAVSPRFWPPAPAAVGAAALVWLAGHAGNAAIIEQIAFISLLIAGAAGVFGLTNVKNWAIPFALLFFMVPFGEFALPALQNIAARGALATANMLGAEARLDGLLIDTPGGALLVGPSCAGLNFLLAATMLALAYSYSARLSARRTAAFIGTAAVTAILANLARVALIIAMAARSGREIDIAADHFGLSLVFYGIILFALAALALLFTDGRPTRTAPAPPAPAPSRAGAIFVVAALVSLPLAAGTYARLIVNHEPEAVVPANLPPLNAPGWRILPSAIAWAAPPADTVASAAYAHGAMRVEVLAAFLTHERRGRETTVLAAPPADWRKVEKGPTFRPPISEYHPLTTEIFENPEGRRFAVARLYWLDETPYGDVRRLKLVQTGQRLRGRQAPAGAFTFVAPEDALGAFLADAEHFARWRARLHAKARG